MENTIKNKSAFIGCYMNQPILYSKIWGNAVEVCFGYNPAIVNDNEAHLKLKQLYQIKDEEAIEIAKIRLKTAGLKVENGEYLVNRHDNFDVSIVFCSDGFHRSVIIQENSIIHFDSFSQISIEEGDFLRSKGYAIPYMGLSVEKLVEYGWVVLA